MIPFEKKQTKCSDSKWLIGSRVLDSLSMSSCWIFHVQLAPKHPTASHPSTSGHAPLNCMIFPRRNGFLKDYFPTVEGVSCVCCFFTLTSIVYPIYHSMTSFQFRFRGCWKIRGYASSRPTASISRVSPSYTVARYRHGCRSRWWAAHFRWLVWPFLVQIFLGDGGIFETKGRGCQDVWYL